MFFFTDSKVETVLNVVHVMCCYSDFNGADILLTRFSFSVLPGTRVLGIKEMINMTLCLFFGHSVCYYVMATLVHWI